MTTNVSTSSANGIITVALGLLAAGLVFMVLTGRDVPIVGNGAGALLTLGVIGIVMCTMSGIGPVQGSLGWTHPLTIVGSILGVAAVLVVVLPLLGVQSAVGRRHPIGCAGPGGHHVGQGRLDGRGAFDRVVCTLALIGRG